MLQSSRMHPAIKHLLEVQTVDLGYRIPFAFQRVRVFSVFL